MGVQERSQPAREDDSAYRAPEVSRVAQLFGRRAGRAFLSYLALSVLFFGRGVLADPAASYIGRGPDAQAYVWFLAWFAYAISHRLNPLLTTVVWVPSGANLTWTTNFPLAAGLLYPVTRLYGPIVSCNVLHLIGPPLAGWSAFVLCRYLVHRFWPALLAGYLFAFSPYMLTGMVNGVLLMLIFPVPLAVWAALRRLAGELGARGFVTILVLLLAIEFLMSPEICATGALFGTIALALAYQTAPAEEQARLLAAAVSIILAYAISAVILLPYLYYMFALGTPRGVLFSPWRTSIDLANFFVPTTTNQLGILAFCGAIAHRFLNELSESGGYVGLPLIAVVALFVRERWHERAGRYMVYMFAGACVLAMGPLLEIVGYRLMPFPASALVVVPLIDKAMPARFMMYAYLALAVMVAMWFAEDRGRRGLRWALGLAIVPFMLPNLSTSFWTTPAEVPNFFSSGLYRQYLTPGQTVMVLPYGLFGEGDLWQATTDMYFRMAGGYVGFAPPVPEEHSGWPIMSGLYNLAGVPDAGDQLKAYLANHDVSTVVLGPHTQYLVLRIGSSRTAATWLRRPTVDRERVAMHTLLASLDTQPLEVGGITLYRLRPETLARYRQLTALEMQRRSARARFGALLFGAERYLSQGRNPTELTPQALQTFGLVPIDWFGGDPFPSHDRIGNPLFHLESILSASKNDAIEVGIEGSYAALKPIIDRYGAQASAIYFPYPRRLMQPTATLTNGAAMMVMEFNRTGLARAAAAATTGVQGQREPAAAPSAALSLPSRLQTAQEIP
jgi:hypothetical protein